MSFRKYIIVKVVTAKIVGLTLVFAMVNLSAIDLNEFDTIVQGKILLSFGTMTHTLN